MKRVLFYDLHSTGHHGEYIEYLINYCPNLEKVRFALSQKLSQRFEEHRKVIIEIPFSEQEQDRRKELKWILKIKNRYKIDYVFFCNIDPYLSSLLKIHKSFGFFSGIYFHPYHRISIKYSSGFFTKTKNILKIIKGRYLAYSLDKMRIKPSLLILDDESGVEELNKKYNIFKYLEDPINVDRVNIKGGSFNEIDKIKILVFGSIIPRKNLEALIHNIKINNFFNDYYFKIIGKGKESYVKKLQALYSGEEKNISIENRFVSMEEVENLFSSCDIVLMVYKNFFGSSGVLGRAAKYEKKVIVSKGGLIEHLVKKYELGLAIESNYKNLAKALNDLRLSQIQLKHLKYLRSKTPQNFAKTIYITAKING